MEGGEIAALDPSLKPPILEPPTPAGQQEGEQTVFPTKIWDLIVSVTFCSVSYKQTRISFVTGQEYKSQSSGLVGKCKKRLEMLHFFFQN